MAAVMPTGLPGAWKAILSGVRVPDPSTLCSSDGKDDRLAFRSAELLHPDIFDFGHRGAGWTEWVG